MIHAILFAQHNTKNNTVVVNLLCRILKNEVYVIHENLSTGTVLLKIEFSFQSHFHSM